MHLVFNDRAKLTAAWFNTLATALIAAGAFAPAAAYLYGLSVLPFSGVAMMVLVGGCFGLGVCLHLVGRKVPGKLRECALWKSWCLRRRYSRSSLS
jgi:hypothetical protein